VDRLHRFAVFVALVGIRDPLIKKDVPGAINKESSLADDPKCFMFFSCKKRFEYNGVMFCAKKLTTDAL
jgi:hypothetical protein